MSFAKTVGGHRRGDSAQPRWTDCVHPDHAGLTVSAHNGSRIRWRLGTAARRTHAAPTFGKGAPVGLALTRLAVRSGDEGRRLPESRWSAQRTLARLVGDLARPSRGQDASGSDDRTGCKTVRRRRKCAWLSTITWSRHSRRIEPIRRSAYGFCQGLAGLRLDGLRRAAPADCRVRRETRRESADARRAFERASVAHRTASPERWGRKGRCRECHASPLRRGWNQTLPNNAFVRRQMDVTR